MEKFSLKRYILFTLVILLLTTGFVLMAGPKYIPGEFNEEMFNFRRITVAPVIILLAYVLIIAIIFKQK